MTAATVPRVAAIYDVHGNLPALDAVLAELEDELILVGGHVTVGPWPAAALERLRELGARARFIRGNADRELTELPKPEREAGPQAKVLGFVRAQLSSEQLDFLGGLPLTESIEVEGLGEVLFCHATPRSDEELLTRISPDERWQNALSGVRQGLVMCGHTHVQFDRRIGDTRVVNAGSVGMPYEHEPGAYWAMLGSDVELRRTVYEPGDLESSGWPEEWPSSTPEEATEYFERFSRERA